MWKAKVMMTNPRKVTRMQWKQTEKETIMRSSVYSIYE